MIKDPGFTLIETDLINDLIHEIGSRMSEIPDVVIELSSHSKISMPGNPNWRPEPEYFLLAAGLTHSYKKCNLNVKQISKLSANVNIADIGLDYDQVVNLKDVTGLKNMEIY